MNINSVNFQVREGDEVDLEKGPTKIDPVYKSKEHYKELLDDNVAQLSLQQKLLYASNSYAFLLTFQAMDGGRKRRGHQTRDVRCQSARLSSIQPQAS
jgi:hypothetical protein